MTIDFTLTDRQRMIREGVHFLARDLIRPLTLQIDRERRVPEDLLRRIAQLGASMGGVPEELGRDDEVEAGGETPSRRSCGRGHGCPSHSSAPGFALQSR